MGYQGSVWSVSQGSNPDWRRLLAGSVAPGLAPGLTLNELTHESLPFCLVQLCQAFVFY